MNNNKFNLIIRDITNNSNLIRGNGSNIHKINYITIRKINYITIRNLIDTSTHNYYYVYVNVGDSINNTIGNITHNLICRELHNKLLFLKIN